MRSRDAALALIGAESVEALFLLVAQGLWLGIILFG
jgi:hypothetical protein